MTKKEHDEMCRQMRGGGVAILSWCTTASRCRQEARDKVKELPKLEARMAQNVLIIFTLATNN
jgi:hypothetical protein